jgi:hypothetical protein
MLSKGNKLYPISEKYNDLLNTLCSVGEPINPSEITQEIFIEMSLIRYYGWVYSNNMNRMVRHTTAELFQDLIAHKLKRAFVGYENVKLVLEEKGKQIKIESKNKTPHVDIAIKYEDVPSVLIEVKTNIGWSRPKSDEWVAMSNRFHNLSKSFKVEREDIFLILETPMNVSKSFTNYWWDKKNNKKWDDPNLPDYWIYQQVIPLYYSADPYYWDEFKEFRKEKNETEYPNLEDVMKVINDKKKTAQIMNLDKIINKVKGETNYG